MKICFVSKSDPYDRRSFSGTHYNLLSSLKKKHDVEWIGELPNSKWENYYWKVVRRLDKLRGSRTSSNHTTFFSKWNGRQIAKKLKNADYDVIFAPASSDCIAFLHTSIPIVYLSDATFQLLIDYYSHFTGLGARNIEVGNLIEKNAIKNAWKIIYSSDWAAQSAINFYGAEKSKVSTIDFGPNLMSVPGREEVDETLQKKETCNLIFIARDWKRKGGDIVYQTFLKLRKDGFPCKLTIIGCDPTLEEQQEHICIIPFLDKNKEEEFKILYQHLLNTHFLLLPTVADCTPMVFSEAAAFGIPVLTTDTGGISSVIQEGVNGFMFPVSAGPPAYAEKIKSLFANASDYAKLRKQCRQEYENRLNWNTWSEKFDALFEELPKPVRALDHAKLESQK